MAYTITLDGSLLRDADGAFIPADPRNSDYATYLAWVDAGNQATQPSAAAFLEAAKDAKRTEIDQARDLARSAGFAWNNNPVDSDEVSERNLIGAALQASLGLIPPGFAWRMANNTLVTVSAADLIAMAAALSLHVQTTYARSWERKAAVAAASTPEAVAAIVW